MDSNEKKDQKVSNIEIIKATVESEYKKIIIEEVKKRDEIELQKDYLNQLVEQDNLNFKLISEQEHATKNEMFNEIEKELEVAINNGDVELIEKLSQKMINLNNRK